MATLSKRHKQSGDVGGGQGRPRGAELKKTLQSMAPTILENRRCCSDSSSCGVPYVPRMLPL